MFSRIGNFLYHSSSVNKNSISYINKQNENITLDPSGTDYVEYSTDSDYFTEAHSLIPNSESQVTTTALKLQDSSTANNFFFSSLAVSSLGDFTLCVKHKLNAPSTSTDIISHYFTSPQYDISLSVPYVSETIPFNVIVSKASDGPLNYEVSGNLIVSDLTNGDISGTLSTVESVLPYTLNAGTSGKDFVFLLKDLDISLNTHIYTQYTVTVTDLDTSPAFSLNGVRKESISFTGGVSYVFDQSDNTNDGYRIMFGETRDSTPYYTTGVTEVGTPGQSGAYTKIEYSGSTELFYFNAGTADMGNTPPDWVEKASVVINSLDYDNVTVGSSRIYTNTAFYDKNLGLITSLNYGNRMSKNGEYVLYTESYAIYRRKYDTNGNNIGTNTLVPQAGGTHMPWGHGVISDDGSVIISPRGGGISISFNGSSMGGHSNPQYFYTSTSTNYKRTKGLSGSGNCFLAAHNTTLLFYSISGTTITSRTITSRGSTTIENITDLEAYPIPISYNGLIYALKHYNTSTYVVSWKVYKRTSVTTNNHTIIGEFISQGYLSLSSDGTHIAIAEPTAIQYKNVISVYKYDGSGTSWTKIGSSINTNPASSSSPGTIAMGYIDDSLTTLYIADNYPSTSKTLKKYDFE